MLFIEQASAAFTARPALLPSSLQPRSAVRASLADVEQLHSLVLPRSSAASKTQDQLEQISTLHEQLSASGGDRYLTDGSLYGNYEVAFFDRSVDGNRSNDAKKK